MRVILLDATSFNKLKAHDSIFLLMEYMDISYTAGVCTG